MTRRVLCIELRGEKNPLSRGGKGVNVHTLSWVWIFDIHWVTLAVRKNFNYLYVHNMHLMKKVFFLYLDPEVSSAPGLNQEEQADIGWCMYWGFNEKCTHTATSTYLYTGKDSLHWMSVHSKYLLNEICCM